MKILVFSDSHGDSMNLKKVVNIHQDAEVIIFCGDGIEEVVSLQKSFPNIKFYTAKGNCDIFSSNPISIFTDICDTKFMITHGHSYYVKSDLRDLKFAANSNEANIICFGHTHIPLCEYDNGKYYINPGSVKGINGTFGLIEIRNQNVLCKIVNIDKLKA